MIKRFIFTATLLACPLAAATLTGTCKRVLDGDTFILDNGTTVQIWGIDAPEKGQPYASSARNFLEKAIKERRLTIAVKDTDQYGRVVGTVKAGKEDIGHLMAYHGMAWHDEHNAPHAGNLGKAMTSARTNRKGLWADEFPVRPYDFRKKKAGTRPKAKAVADELQCERVLDGDTIELTNGTTVRLWGIDAPEKGQSYADIARNYLKELCEGKTVRLEKKDEDQYGRTVAVVYLDTMNLNLHMISAGFAWHYAYFAPDAKDFAAAEKSARLSRRGLWKDPAPVNPYVFRKNRKP